MAKVPDAEYVCHQCGTYWEIVPVVGMCWHSDVCPGCLSQYFLWVNPQPFGIKSLKTKSK